MDLGLILKIGLVVVAATIGIASRFLFKKPADNVIEQIAEEVIKEETGMSVDLSPDTQGDKDVHK